MDPEFKKRPAAVTLAAVLLFFYAAFCVPCGCFGVAIGLHPGFGHGPQPPPGQKEELFAIGGVYLVVSAVMVWAGVGVLRLLPGARLTAYWATAGHLVLVIFHDLFVLSYIAPQRHPIGMHTLKDEGFWVMMVCPTILPLMLAFFIVALLNLKGSRAAFVVAPSPRRDDFRLWSGTGDDDDRPAKNPKNPGDTGITERPDAT